MIVKVVFVPFWDEVVGFKTLYRMWDCGVNIWVVLECPWTEIAIVFNLVREDMFLFIALLTFSISSSYGLVLLCSYFYSKIIFSKWCHPFNNFKENFNALLIGRRLYVVNKLLTIESWMWDFFFFLAPCTLYFELLSILIRGNELQMFTFVTSDSEIFSLLCTWEGNFKIGLTFRFILMNIVCFVPFSDCSFFFLGRSMINSRCILYEVALLY